MDGQGAAVDFVVRCVSQVDCGSVHSRLTVFGPIVPREVDNRPGVGISFAVFGEPIRIYSTHFDIIVGTVGGEAAIACNGKQIVVFFVTIPGHTAEQHTFCPRNIQHPGIAYGDASSMYNHSKARRRGQVPVYGYNGVYPAACADVDSAVGGDAGSRVYSKGIIVAPRQC